MVSTIVIKYVRVFCRSALQPVQVEQLLIFHTLSIGQADQRLRTPGHHRTASGVPVSNRWEAISTPGMCVCVCVCMYVYMYARIYIMYVCTYASM